MLPIRQSENCARRRAILRSKWSMSFSFAEIFLLQRAKSTNLSESEGWHLCIHESHHYITTPRSRVLFHPPQRRIDGAAWPAARKRNSLSGASPQPVEEEIRANSAKNRAVYSSLRALTR